MDSTASLVRPWLRAAAVLAACCTLPAAAFNHDRIVAPISPGRLPVACSNVAQDTSKIAPGATASDYWEGRPVGGVDHYVDEILAAPQTALKFDAAVPGNRELFSAHAGGRVTFVAIVCFPTSPSNADANYVLPQTGGVIPHMQPAGTAPKLITQDELCSLRGLPCPVGPAVIPARLPLIVFSHGLGGSPIGSGYIDAVVQLASQGFMVAGTFHGDSRFSRVRIEDLSDVIYLLRDFDRVIEMMTMRPLSLKAMTDVLLSSAAYAPGVDTTRIGGFGASLGGQAMTILLGSRLTTTIGGHCSDGIVDPRIRAAVGYVPYAGQSFLPAFCEGQSGAAGVNRPYLAISGTADTTAPIGMMEKAVQRFTSSRYLVQLIDGQHELRPEDAGDLFTWMVTFFNAYLDVRSDPTAMARFIRMNGVTGGRDDSLLIDVHVPFAPAPGEALVRELYNPIINHYTMSADSVEGDTLKAGNFGAGWDFTGMSFKAWSQWPAAAPDAAAVCRFRGAYQNAAASTFYTASRSECDTVLLNRGWRYVGIGFYALNAASNACPDGYLGVHRAYNNGFVRNDSNHRYTTSDSTMKQMRASGWIFEGTVMCSPP